MAAENNVITKADIQYAREVDFINRFNAGLKSLMTVLGIVRPIPKQAGTVLKAYVADGTLENGYVPEGEIIPLSNFKVKPVTFREIMLQKYRKASTGEAIVGGSYSQAVTKTDSKALRLLQSGIKTNFYDFLATGTSAISGADFQKTLANVRGRLAVLFEDIDVQPVYFVNPMDVATYLGNAPITIQTAFGMDYIENFLGLGTVIEAASVPQGTVYGTVRDNINLYYIPVNGADGLGEAFDFTTDETGYIGIHHSGNYERLQFETELISGLVLFAERLDGIVVGSIGANAPTATTVTPLTTGTQYDVPVSSIQSGVTLDGDSFKGTLKFLSGSNAITDVWGEGNFLALDFSNFPDLSVSGNSVYVGFEPSMGSGLVPIATDDHSGVFKVTNKDAQVFKVATTVAGHTTTKTYKISDLVLESDEA